MRIAVASGKGGTGKTTVAVSLALSMAYAGEQISSVPPAPLFLDCDVEAPNAHIFLKPAITHRQTAGIQIPLVDEEKCTHCGICAQVCQYHAIAALGKKVLIFPQLCHGCGSCAAMCPSGAITESVYENGVLERGVAREGIDFARGVLNTGEPMAVPVIRQLKEWARPAPDQTVIVDAPPGTSCPVVEAVKDADYLLLVSEPTPFGLHDLRLAVEVTRELQIPAGVVINRSGSSYDEQLEAYCREYRLPVLLRIPFERQIAEGIARGSSLIEIHPEYQAQFLEMAAVIQVTQLEARSIWL
jgi:MinD superfamily P-loop ATPase